MKIISSYSHQLSSTTLFLFPLHFLKTERLLHNLIVLIVYNRKLCTDKISYTRDCCGKLKNLEISNKGDMMTPLSHERRKMELDILYLALTYLLSGKKQQYVINTAIYLCAIFLSFPPPGSVIGCFLYHSDNYFTISSYKWMLFCLKKQIMDETGHCNIHPLSLSIPRLSSCLISFISFPTFSFFFSSNPFLFLFC